MLLILLYTKLLQLATFSVRLAVEHIGANFYNFNMEEKIRQNLAYNLKVERAKKSLTQEKLAELADVSTKHITKIERRKVTPSIYIVYKLAKVLNVTVDKLIADIEN